MKLVSQTKSTATDFPVKINCYSQYPWAVTKAATCSLSADLPFLW